MPTAFILINTEPGSMPEVAKAVRAVEGVDEAEMVFGNYDVVAKVKVETMEELKKIIAYKIRRIEKVLATQSILVVDRKSPLSSTFSSLVSIRKIERGFTPEP